MNMFQDKEYQIIDQTISSILNFLKTGQINLKSDDFILAYK
jgi:hypothetical protein